MIIGGIESVNLGMHRLDFLYCRTPWVILDGRSRIRHSTHVPEVVIRVVEIGDLWDLVREKSLLGAAIWDLVSSAYDNETGHEWARVPVYRID